MPTTMTTRMHWKGGMQFGATSEFGHKLTTDISIKGGGEEAGYKPTELLLWGVAACTGVDVVRVLQKQRQDLTGLEIEVSAEQPDGYPKPFQNIEIRYIFRGRDLDPKKLQQAIELSESKYCSVSQTVRNETQITTSIEVVEDEPVAEETVAADDNS